MHLGVSDVSTTFLLANLIAPSFPAFFFRPSRAPRAAGRARRRPTTIQRRQATTTMSNPVAPTKAPKEPVLLVPPRLTQSAYALLVKNDLVPRKWHLEGRYGSRTFRPSKHRPQHRQHKDGADGDDKEEEDRRMALPLLPCAANRMETSSRRDLDDEIQNLLATPDVELVYCEVPHPKSAPKVQHIDATVHPELAPPQPPTRSRIRQYSKASSFTTSPTTEPIKRINAEFTFMELFSGIGGFGLALEALGGRCLFASEINEDCNAIYIDNLRHAPAYGIHGDIYNVPDDAFPKSGECDLLVAGFPCQPFSKLGTQPGFTDADRGLLYTQIVRALGVSRPKSFLLENVPGLAEMGDSLKEIVTSLTEIGYDTTVEVVSARGLTAQSRKRLFFVGLLRPENDEDDGREEDFVALASAAASFRFPFIPDLGLRARDIIEFDNNDKSKHEKKEKKKEYADFDRYRLSPAQMDQLLNRSKRWKPAKLAWPENVLDTLDGHYGITIGKGNSQLVPGAAPNNPRLFTPRECARVMGFPNWFRIPKLDGEGDNDCGTDDDGVAERSHRKRLYLMFGNAVCPPLIAALAGAVLAECKKGEVGMESKDAKDATRKEVDWRSKGLELAIALSLESVLEEQRGGIEDSLSQTNVLS